MGADVLQRLLVLPVFIAVVVEEGLDALAGFVLFAVPAGDVASGQTAFLHLARLKSREPSRYPDLQPLQVF